MNNPHHWETIPVIEAPVVPDMPEEESAEVELQDPFGMTDEDWLEMRTSIDQIDCDQDRLIKAWRASSMNGVAPGKNLEVAQVLNELRPGAVGFLEDEYDIEHFARYPLELLVDMYDNRDASGPWGLLVFAKSDHNDAFYYEVEALREMHAAVGDDVHIRIVECDSVKDAGGLLAKLAKDHGKANFLGICGHGTPESISLGDSGGEDRQITRDTVAAQLGEYRAHLDGEAEICLVSCSTASGSNSVAQEIATTTNRTTIGADSDTSLASFGASIKGGRVHFEPQYTDASARRFEPERDDRTTVAGLLVGTLTPEESSPEIHR